MNRKLAIFAAIIAAFAYTTQAADAHGLKLGNKRITAVAVGAGAASTLTFLSLNSWKWGTGNGTNGLSTWGAAGVATIGCMAISPMVATVVMKRPLTMREGHVLMGSCIVPIIGGWLVNHAYNAHPAWEPGRKPHNMRHHGKRHHGKRKMM